MFEYERIRDLAAMPCERSYPLGEEPGDVYVCFAANENPAFYYPCTGGYCVPCEARAILALTARLFERAAKEEDKR